MLWNYIQYVHGATISCTLQLTSSGRVNVTSLHDTRSDDNHSVLEESTDWYNSLKFIGKKQILEMKLVKL